MCRTGHVYTPTETVKYEELVRFYFSQKYSNEEQTLGQIKIDVIAYMSIPKSASKVMKQKMLSGEIRPTKKPDWDNVGKIITDALNNVAYHDDSQIVKANVEKFYSDEPRVEVKISNVQGNK